MAITASNNPNPCGQEQETGALTSPRFEILYFGAGAYQNTSGNSTSAAEFEAHINSVGFTITAGRVAIMNITVKRQINGQSVMAKENYYFKNNHIPGTWGTSSTNGEVEFSDFIFDSQKIVTNVDSNTDFIDLGDIANLTIVQHVNDVLSPNVDLEDGTRYIFDCIRAGIRETYEYIGTLPVTIGSTSPDDDVVTQDFDLLASGVTSGGGFIPNLQQILLAGATTDQEPTFEAGATFGNGSFVFLTFALAVASWIYADDNELFLFHAKKLVLSATEGVHLDTGQVVTSAPTGWNANTNTPTLSNSDTNKKGVEYIVTEAGTVDFGAGPIPFGVNDIASNDGSVYYKKVDNNQGGGSASPPVDDQYADITALIADQNNQLEDYLYRVVDASDDPNVASGAAVYIYEGTTDGDLGDYFLLRQEGFLPSGEVGYGNASGDGITSNPDFHYNPALNTLTFFNGFFGVSISSTAVRVTESNGNFVEIAYLNGNPTVKFYKGGFGILLNAPTVTADRDVQFQDKAGTVALLDDVSGGGIITATKLSDESKTNDDVPASDTTVKANLEANSRYDFEFEIYHASGASADFKVDLAIPSGATGYRIDDANNNTIATQALVGEKTINGLGESVIGYYMIKGFIKTTSAGEFALKWSANINSAQQATLKEGTHLKLIKLD